MIEKKAIQSLVSNNKKIISNLKEVFDISAEESVIIVALLIKASSYYIYKDTIGDDLLDYFNRKNLENLKSFFEKINVSPKIIKGIVISNPEILFYSNKLDMIFPIFKSDDFKGYLLYNEPAGIFSAYGILYDKETNEFKKSFPYSLFVQDMLKLVERKDLREYYGITDDSSLYDKLIALSSDYSKNNYYFYKEFNTLLEIRAAETTKGEDNLCHCDLCRRGFDQPQDLIPFPIVPITEGGEYDLYNLSFLCIRCASMVTADLGGIDYRYHLINSAGERIKKTLPGSYYEFKAKVIPYKEMKRKL